MEVFFILSTSGTAVRKALTGTDGCEVARGTVADRRVVWCGLDSCH